MSARPNGHVLVATGVKREAATLRGTGLIVVTGGGDPVGLRARLEAAAEGATGILSYGFAGALADGLRIGDWVVGDRLAGAVEMDCDPAWRDALAARLPGARVGAIYADGRMIATAAEKRALGAHYRALAADMESHVAAALAVERGLPFAILRCVSDEAHRDLPPAITLAMRPDGGVALAAMMGSLAKQPGQIGDLCASIAGFSRAMGALKRGAERILSTHLIDR